MGLVLHCKLKYRVWPHAHMGRLRLKIFFTPKYLPKRPHWTKFRQNPRNGGSQRLHEIENLSVNVLLPFWKVLDILLYYAFQHLLHAKKKLISSLDGVNF